VEFVKAVTGPMLRALRIMDQQIITPNAAAALWDSLGPRLVTAIKAEENDDIAKDDKIGVLKAYLKRADEASCDVLDAAWVLDPVNWEEVVRLAASDSTTDEKVWMSLLESTQAVIRRIVNRTKCTESVLEREGALARALQDLNQYISRTGVFSNKTVTEDVDPQTWWSGCAGVLLSKYARRLLNVCVTISNDERIHKLYAGMQPPERTRLTPERTDALVQAAFWLQATRLESKGVNMNVKDFIDLPSMAPAEYAACLKELETPAQSETAAEDADSNPDDGDSSESDGDNDDAIVEAVSEVVQPGPPASAASEEAAESESIGGTHAAVVDGIVVRRSRRAVRVSARMAGARVELGMDTE